MYMDGIKLLVKKKRMGKNQTVTIYTQYIGIKFSIETCL